MFSYKRLLALASALTFASAEDTSSDHFKCKSTDPEVCNFEPPEEVVYMRNSSGGIHRMIWEGMKLFPEEYERYEEFK